MSGVLDGPPTLVSIDRSRPADVAVSSVRAVLARYQLVYDRLEQTGPVAWIAAGSGRLSRWPVWPAPRGLTRLLLTYHVRARLDVLRRRSRAQAAVMKHSGPAEDNLRSLDLF